MGKKRDSIKGRGEGKKHMDKDEGADGEEWNEDTDRPKVGRSSRNQRRFSEGIYVGCAPLLGKVGGKSATWNGVGRGGRGEVGGGQGK